MTVYNVKFTDSNKTPIDIEESTEDSTSLDISLFGRIKLEYGEQLNENLLHLLEHFACHQDEPSDEFYPVTPNYDLALNNLLENPTAGQLWYNKTQERFFIWTGSEWIPIGTGGDYAANWGQIANGNSLPKPVSYATGRVFEYDECIWSVSPSNLTGEVDFMRCYTDADAVVTMQQRFSGTNTFYPGVANYLIIGIRGNLSLGDFDAVMPSPSVTPTPTPTRTATPGASIGTTPTPTPTVTPTSTPVASGSPSPLSASLSGMDNLQYSEVTCLQDSSVESSTSKTPTTSVLASASGGTPPYTYTWNITTNTCGGFVSTSSSTNSFYVDYVGDIDDIGAGCYVEVEADVDDSGVQSVTTAIHRIDVITYADTVDCCIVCEDVVNDLPCGSVLNIAPGTTVQDAEYTSYVYPPCETCAGDNGWYSGIGSTLESVYGSGLFGELPGLPPGITLLTGPILDDEYPIVPGITVDTTPEGCIIPTETVGSWAPLEFTFKITDKTALDAYITANGALSGFGFNVSYKSGGPTIRVISGFSVTFI